jgi:hypothetical protein
MTKSNSTMMSHNGTLKYHSIKYDPKLVFLSCTIQARHMIHFQYRQSIKGYAYFSILVFLSFPEQYCNITIMLNDTN